MFPGSRPSYASLPPPKRNVKEYQQDIRKAINTAFNPHPTAFKKVSVLLMHWDNDDLNVAPLEQDLGKVFQKIYGFDVEYYLIKATPTTSIDFVDTLLKFWRRNASTDSNLTILVYTGHAMVDTLQGATTFSIGGAIDNATGDLQGPRIKWNNYTQVLQDIPGDVLHILDCCYAGEAITLYGPEVLAATSATETAASESRTCFTTGLIKKLKELNGAPITVASLASELHRDRKHLKLEYAPTHAARTNHPSIILQKMHTPVPNLYSGKGKVKSSAKNDTPRALITVHLDEDFNEKSIEALKKWLFTELPAAVSEIEITLQGSFKSGSSLLIFTVPLEVWSCLESHPAYGFVGIVQGNNQLLQSSGVQASVSNLSIRGSESQNPTQGHGYK